MSDGDAADLSELEPPRRTGSLKTRSLVLGGVLVVAAGAGIYTWQQAKPIVEARKYAKVTYEVPDAPKLTPAEGETVYRIDPSKSSLTYAVSEEFAGKETSTAKGSTSGIAGDIAIDPTDLAATRVGTMVVNLEQLSSDNNLRDARLRLDYLESHTHPLATFEPDEVTGLEGELVESEAQEFSMTGDLTVKDITKPATFEGTATLDDGALKVTAATDTKLSDFDAGPIRIAGMVSTSDDAELTLKLTAYDPTVRTIPTRISGPDAKEPTGGPSFAKTVQPILEGNCVSCHNTGKMGAHALTIDTAGDARGVSDGLKTVTQLKHMPPWPASDEGVPLKHKMVLTQAEIDAIAEWSDAGAPLDVSPDALVKPAPVDPGPQPRKDIVLDRPAYTGSTENTNDYRCFVLDPEITEPTFLTGYTFLGDQMEQLHHAQVFHISAEQVASSAAVDGKDGQPGWSCYSGPDLAGKRPSKVPGRAPKRDVGFSGQANLVAGWVPGQGPSDFGKDVGILMEPGDALVLQLHYHYTGDPAPDRSTLAIQVDDGDKDLKALRVINPIGPVEIPCAPEDQDAPLCDRDAALADNVRLYGPSGAANEAGLLMLCGKTPEDLTKDFDGQVASSSCDLKVPEDGTITAVLGHMHTLGKTFRLSLDAGTDDEQVLLDIPEWSFDWQMNYELETPIKVKAGQSMRMECSWDRSADPLRPPKYIVFAEGTEDEMCFATYALIPDDQG
jgi:polyisoprenoid-binding protein YceI/mono/diheme cytochrome c family protein